MTTMVWPRKHMCCAPCMQGENYPHPTKPPTRVPDVQQVMGDAPTLRQRQLHTHTHMEVIESVVLVWMRAQLREPRCSASCVYASPRGHA